MQHSSVWLQRLAGVVSKTEDLLLGLLLSAMVLIAVVQIVLRNGWETGIGWGDPLVRVLLLWVGLLGAIIATREERHIRIDVLTRYLPARFSGLARYITEWFSAVVCALLAYHGGRLVWDESQYGSVMFGTVPTWLCQLIIPIGFGLMALRFALAPLVSNGPRQQEAGEGC